MLFLQPACCPTFLKINSNGRSTSGRWFWQSFAQASKRDLQRQQESASITATPGSVTLGRPCIFHGGHASLWKSTSPTTRHGFGYTMRQACHCLHASQILPLVCEGSPLMTDIHRQNAGATRRNNAWLKRQAWCQNCKKFGAARLQPASQNSRQSAQLCSGANWNGTSHGLDPSRPWPKANAKTSQRCRCETQLPWQKLPLFDLSSTPKVPGMSAMTSCVATLPTITLAHASV